VLSDREAQILNLVKSGRYLKEAAREVGISENTIKNHMVTIKRKLGALTQTHAVYIALKKGIIPFD
jgi:DNA-binding CsgD family transcriptional regulator